MLLHILYNNRYETSVYDLLERTSVIVSKKFFQANEGIKFAKYVSFFDCPDKIAQHLQIVLNVLQAM